MKKILGVDVGGMTIKFGIFTDEYVLEKKWAAETTKDVVTQIAEEVFKAAEEEGGKPDEIFIGVGICVPGPVTEDGHLTLCPNVNLKDCYPAVEIEEKIGVPCVLSNDSNAAALGEYTFGGGKKYNSAVLMTLGTAIGSGVIINGRIIIGAHGAGGELGHIHVRDDETVQCGCGGYGCLEQVASATGIVREARRALARGEGKDSPLAKMNPDDIVGKDVCDAAKAGDPFADGVMRFCFKFLGEVLTKVTCTIDPDCYILGGGISKTGQYLCDIINEYYIKHLTITDKPADIVIAKLGNDAGIYGCAKLAHEISLGKRI